MALNDKQVKSYMSHRKKGVTQAVAAVKAGISVRSGRRIEKGQHLPVKQRHWRTRTDPLKGFWEETVEPLLRSRPKLAPSTLLELLQEQYPDQVPDSLKRTLQRRIKGWKVQFGEEKEVMFRQEHKPGLQALSDFTELEGAGVTIDGKPLEHRLFHFRLAWSKWSWMRVVLGGESFTALAEGMQEALAQLGGVPIEHRTDSLSAAWKNLSTEDREDLTARYAAVCEQYGMLPTRNNVGKGHENGSVESAHGHLKHRICQALLLRGNADFASLEAYRSFITQQVLRHNRRNQDQVKEEVTHLKPLPPRRCSDYEESSVRVTSSSTITVRLVVYSVPSRLIGQMLKVRLWDDRLSGYIGSQEVMNCQRIRPPKGKRRARCIDFRHLIGSLVKKPGAFYHATLRDDILPGKEWQSLWQDLCVRLLPRVACRLMVQALKLAADSEEITQVAQALRAVLREPGEPDLQALMRHLGMKAGALPEGEVVQHDLSSYDQLLACTGVCA